MAKKQQVKKIRLSDKILPAFASFHKALKQQLYTNYVLKGGRASAKSSTVAEEIVIRRMKYKSHALAIRRYEKYCSGSVFEQLKWAIDHLEVGHLWKERKSPLRLTYIPTGASILFAGADDPTRIKSIKTSDMPITDLWVEEAAEFKTEDDITTITNSIIRGELPEGLSYCVFITYNPPKRKNHWLNKKYESQFVDASTFVHHSTYKDNPYLSKQMLLQISETKAQNEQKYEWDYLGKPVGSGVVPFNNLVFRTITDEEIKTFDNIKMGIDWGYGVDPVSFGRMHYDRTRRKLYIFGEIYGVKIGNRELAAKIKEKGWNDGRITADSAEPKSVDEMKKDHGIDCKGAKKGPGSVEYGEKWLDELNEIIIDPHRCPNTAKEWEDIDYKTDRNGEPMNKLQETDNHSIDMVRYACEDEMKAKRRME